MSIQSGHHVERRHYDRCDLALSFVAGFVLCAVLFVYLLAR